MILHCWIAPKGKERKIARSGMNELSCNSNSNNVPLLQDYPKFFKLLVPLRLLVTSQPSMMLGLGKKHPLTNELTK